MKIKLTVISGILVLLLIGSWIFFLADHDKRLKTEENNYAETVTTSAKEEILEPAIKIRELPLAETVLENMTVKTIHCSNPTQEDIDRIAKNTGLKELKLKLEIGDLYPDLSPLSNLRQLEKLEISGGELNYDFLETLDHLIEVDISGFGVKDLSCFQYMKELERLSVSYIETVDFQYLENLIKLEELELGLNFGGETRNHKSLKQLSYLSVLYIDYPSQEDIDYIGKLIGLKELQLHGVESELDLSSLGNLQQLEKIDIWGREVDFAFLKKLSNLEEIQISGSVENLSYFQHMKKIKRLSITDIETADFQYLEGLTGLEELRLWDCYERKNHEALRNLSILEIEDPTQEDIDWIGKMTDLKELSLYGNFTELDLTNLGKLIRLKKLSIGDIGIMDLDLSSLAQLKQLEEIVLYGLINTDCSFLRQLTNLKKIALYSTGVEDLSYFQNMKNLEELTATSVSIVDFGYLEGLNRLRKLDISFSKMAEGGSENIRVLGTLSYLSELRLECHSMPDEPIDCSFLYELKGLESLLIRNMAMKSMEPLSGLSSLNWLHLSNVDGDVGHIEMECIGRIKSLQKLTIKYTEVESVQPLSELSFLADLYLDCTNIQDIEALKNLKNLNSLRIKGNTSEKVKEQAELYFSHIKNVEVDGMEQQ